MLCAGTNAVLYELISEMEVNDEWMYVLQERANNVSEYDKGWSLFMKVFSHPKWSDFWVTRYGWAVRCTLG